MALPAAPDLLEAHTGVICGPQRAPAPKAEPVTARAAAVLDGLLLDALRRPPCVVAFSGGRDSSVLLAAAVRVARREGLAPPVALTADYGHESTDERPWQERVVALLGIADWQRVDAGDDLDALGRLGADVLHHHGPYWPGVAHSIRTFAPHARGGTLITGNGGDELFERWGWRRPTARELRALPLAPRLKWTAFSLLPHAARRRAPQVRERVALPWLTLEGTAEVQARLDAERPARSFPADVERFDRSRYLELLRGTLAALAAEDGAGLVEPFSDSRYMRAVAREAPANGFPSRADGLRHHFADLLPEDVLTRRTKVEFSAPVWGPRTRAFAAEWDGQGLDAALVDVAALRRVWAQERPDARSLAPLQLAYVRAASASS